MPGYSQWRDNRRKRLDEQAEHQQRLEATPGSATAQGGGRMEDPRWSAVQALVVSALVTIGVLGSLAALLVVLNETDNGPETSLSLIFVAAAVVLILVVCTLTIVLTRLRLANPEEAMGLPRGSIRAVIALLLILLFFIAAIFLFNSTLLTGERTENRTLRGVDAARYAAIPTDQIVSATPRTADAATVYDVVLYPSSTGTPTSDDLAKQLVTTLATLVTAVAAFYFGANSVQGAIKDVAGPSSSGVRRPGTAGGSPGVARPDTTAAAGTAAGTAGGTAGEDAGEDVESDAESAGDTSEPVPSVAPSTDQEQAGLAPIPTTAAGATSGGTHDTGGTAMTAFDDRPGDEIPPMGEGFDDFPEPDLDEGDVFLDDIHERNPGAPGDEEDRP